MFLWQISHGKQNYQIPVVIVKSEEIVILSLFKSLNVINFLEMYLFKNDDGCKQVMVLNHRSLQ